LPQREKRIRLRFRLNSPKLAKYPWDIGRIGYYEEAIIKNWPKAGWDWQVKRAIKTNITIYPGNI